MVFCLYNKWKRRGFGGPLIWVDGGGGAAGEGQGVRAWLRKEKGKGHREKVGKSRKLQGD